MALKETIDFKEKIQSGRPEEKRAMVAGSQAPMTPMSPGGMGGVASSQPMMSTPPMMQQEKEKKTLIGKLLNTDVKVLDGSISKIGIEIVEARIDKMPPVENALQAMLPQFNTVNKMVDQSRNISDATQGGGLMQLAAGGGGVDNFAGQVPGQGHGMEDNVFMPIVERNRGKQVATLAVSPDEYVLDAHTMSALGNGSADEGARYMDGMVKNIRKKAYGTDEQPNEINGLAALRPMIERV